jgi:membrane-associated phospholipid phosphatase
MIFKMFYSPNNKHSFLYVTHIALFSGLLFWFYPITHPLCQTWDICIFHVLNSTLTHEFWQKFWGILNHRHEVRINLVLAALLNIWAIIDTRDSSLKAIRIKQMFYFWICFQIGFMLQDVLFNKLFCVQRDSPSLVLQPVIKLSETLQNTNIKDASTNSFPGGHAFSMIYWASFSLLVSPKRIGVVGIIFAIILCIPRLISGAHWASDVIFSVLLALCWLSWTIYCPIYQLMTKATTRNCEELC